MKHYADHFSLIALGLAGALALAACGKKEENAPPPVATTTPPATTPPPAAAPAPRRRQRSRRSISARPSVPDQKVTSPTTTFGAEGHDLRRRLDDRRGAERDARREVDVSGRPDRQRFEPDDRTERSGRDDVPHQQARRLAGRQLQGRDLARRQVRQRARISPSSNAA